MNTEKKIRLLEREIEKIKVMHSIGAVSTQDAKKMILELDSLIMKNVCSLPEHEQHLYKIKKEFGYIDL